MNAPGRRFEIFNGMRYFDSETISAEVALAGLSVEATLEVMTGIDWTTDADEMAIVSRR